MFLQVEAVGYMINTGIQCSLLLFFSMRRYRPILNAFSTQKAAKNQIAFKITILQTYSFTRICFMKIKVVWRNEWPREDRAATSIVPGGTDAMSQINLRDMPNTSFAIFAMLFVQTVFSRKLLARVTVVVWEERVLHWIPRGTTNISYICNQ